MYQQRAEIILKWRVIQCCDSYQRFSSTLREGYFVEAGWDWTMSYNTGTLLRHIPQYKHLKMLLLYWHNTGDRRTYPQRMLTVLWNSERILSQSPVLRWKCQHFLLGTWQLRREEPICMYPLSARPIYYFVCTSWLHQFHTDLSNTESRATVIGATVSGLYISFDLVNWPTMNDW